MVTWAAALDRAVLTHRASWARAEGLQNDPTELYNPDDVRDPRKDAGLRRDTQGTGTLFVRSFFFFRAGVRSGPTCMAVRAAWTPEGPGGPTRRLLRPPSSDSLDRSVLRDDLLCSWTSALCASPPLAAAGAGLGRGRSRSHECSPRSYPGLARQFNAPESCAQVRASRAARPAGAYLHLGKSRKAVEHSRLEHWTKADGVQKVPGVAGHCTPVHWVFM